MYINRGNKVCEMCGAEYVPNNRQYKKQRYCSKKCKNKRQWEKKVESGHIRRSKGGYNRTTYIKNGWKQGFLIILHLAITVREGLHLMTLY